MEPVWMVSTRLGCCWGWLSFGDGGAAPGFAWATPVILGAYCIIVAAVGGRGTPPWLGPGLAAWTRPGDGAVLDEGWIPRCGEVLSGLPSGPYVTAEADEGAEGARSAAPRKYGSGFVFALLLE